jgi:nicotinate phosphoribosyltransferase
MQTVSPSLFTDRYELTMLTSFLNEGIANRRATFETFARRLPAGRRYGMLAGIGRLLPMIEGFTFNPSEVAWLLDNGVIDARTAEYLADFRFTGDIVGLREGDVWFPGTPVLTVDSTLAEGVVLETLILSVLNHDAAIASAAARMVTAAGERPLIEMGSRRVHEQAAVDSARAAYVAGFANTSNLAAGYLYGVPTVGTAAHAFTLAHNGMGNDDDPTGEIAAFTSQVRAHGPGTTLLVDTYDIAQGIRNAVAATRAAHPGSTGPGAIRLDSGDLGEEARKARALLDSLGAVDTKITVTSDLDEFVITSLADAPIDGYGAGTRVATGSGHPTAGMVYKLVAIEDPHTITESGWKALGRVMRPVAKKASGKGSAGGRKSVWRTYDADGEISREVHTVDNATVNLLGRSALVQVPLIDAGRIVHTPSLKAARQHAAHALASLPVSALDVADGSAAITPEVVTAKTTATPQPVLQEA